jgi:nucleoside-diphosphate-sugar epimerase
MRILLTGAGGYIGLHIVRELLAHGHELTALVRSPEKLGPFAQEPRLTIVAADLEQHARVAEALEGHEVCVHAALIWGEPSTEFDLRDTAVAAKLFDAAGRAGLRRCVFISSTAVHRPFRQEMSEEDCLSTDDFYGATKAAGELFLRAACSKHQMTGLVIRPGPVVGPPAFAAGSFRSDRRLAEMVAAATEGRPITVTAGEGRQLSDVATVAKVTRLLSGIENPHATYLCADREILSWEWIARKVVACLSSPSEVRVLPPKANGSIPHFRTERLEELLGGSTDARAALEAHIHHLAGTS